MHGTGPGSIMLAKDFLVLCVKQASLISYPKRAVCTQDVSFI